MEVEEEGQICSWMNRSKVFKTPNLAGWVTSKFGRTRVSRCRGGYVMVCHARGCEQVSPGGYVLGAAPKPMETTPKNLQTAPWHPQHGGEVEKI